ncbi:MAG: alpha/beta hydrolase [Hymenobacteraceae bacterium]|nr:alpha/beta hydrolase [Hymenobacteraceae bacterium]
MPLDPQLQPFLDQLAAFGVPPTETLSPLAARNAPTLKNAVEELAANHAAQRAKSVFKPMPEPVGRIAHVLIPGPAEELLARVYYPADNAQEGARPVLVYFHGGGFVIANLDVYDPSCRALANAAKCIVVSVAYRQGPEARFPAAHDDAYVATQWVIKHARELGGDPARVAVGGESAGGNLATHVCLQARDKGGAMPVYQLLIYPMVQWEADTTRFPSLRENAESRPLNARVLPWFAKYYLSSPADARDPRAAPLHALSHAGLPPALVLTAELDVLRDEGEAYARSLEAAGGRTKCVRYDGMIHEFFGLAGAVDGAKAALQEAANGLMGAFGTDE